MRFLLFSVVVVGSDIDDDIVYDIQPKEWERERERESTNKRREMIQTNDNDTTNKR